MAEGYEPKPAEAYIEPILISDCNNATSTGRYKTISSTLNTPTAYHGILDVFTYNDYELIQIFYDTFGKSFIRSRADNTGWIGWKEFVVGIKNYTTGTTDNAGRILLNFPASNLVNVTVRSTSYWCVPRYVDDGTLVYIYNLGTFTPVTNTSVTLDYIRCY